MPANIHECDAIRVLCLPLCLMRVFVSTLHLKFEFVLSSHTEKPDLALSSLPQQQQQQQQQTMSLIFHFISFLYLV